METLTSETGKYLKLMATESISVQMGTGMKANGLIVSNTVWAQTSFLLEILTLVSTLMESRTAKGRTSGGMARCTQESFSLE